MSAPVDSFLTPVPPTDEEVRIARQSSAGLDRLGRASGSVTLTVAHPDGEEAITVPAVAVRLLGAILDEMARGNAVALAPYEKEISTQKAADLLNVSRPYLIGLLEAGRIPFRKVGTHRRLRLEDVLRYKVRLDEEADRAYRELVAEGQRMGLGYD